MSSPDPPAGAFSVLVLLVACVIWAGHALKLRRVRVVNQGSLALLVGLAAGGGFFLWFEKCKGTAIPPGLVAFDYDLYMYLLSPIIFYSGFSIKKKAFFSNFSTLVLLGVVGTMVNAALLALGAWAALSAAGLATHDAFGNSLALGAVFSSTDSVAALGAIDRDAHPQLHALVFGEAVVNDAVSIVLVRAVQRLRGEAALGGAALAAVLASFARLCVLSLALGVGVGLACAFVLRHGFSGRHSTDREVSLLGALGFLSFVAAEQLGLSGVFAAFFCGLTSSHYAWHALSPSAKVVSVYSFRVLAFIAELALFLLSGLDMWSTSLWHKELYTRRRMLIKALTLAGSLMLLVPAARALTLAPLTALANRWRPAGARINRSRGGALWWAGCARGAVTLALAVYHFVGSAGEAGEEASIENQIICQGCMAAVVISTVVLGGATPAVLAVLAGEAEAERAPGAAAASVNGGDSGQGGAASWDVRSAWVQLDRGYLQPLFGGRTAASLSAYRSPPPSPGRWRGAASAITVLQRDQRRAPPPPEEPKQAKQAGTRRLRSPFMSVREDDEEASELREALLPPGISAGDVSSPRTALEELFGAPANSRALDEALVDEEVALGGLVERAQAGTSAPASRLLG